jgi:4-amino-4-deoxy-L-arabinose transferase-like glycosyltransferase
VFSSSEPGNSVADPVVASAGSVWRTVRCALPYAGLSLLAFIVLFWRLGAAGFWDPDEAHYAETTRELLSRGDWLAPFFNDQPFFDKPIFFHQLQALSMALLGATEFAARLVPALAALALVGITAWLGAALISADVALMSALLLSVSPALFALARYAILDTLFTALLFGGAAMVTVAALRDRPRLQYGGYVLVALAVLTKGPLAVVLCALTFGLAVAISSDARRRLLSLRWMVGVVMIGALSVPWFAYMWWRFGEAFVEGYWLNENIRLFAQPLYRGQPGPTFYVRVLAAGLLPWTGIVVGRIYDDVRRAWSRRDPPDTIEVMLWVWTAAVVGFFTLSQFKLDHYVFPVAPALCLLTARAWLDVRASPFDPAHAGARAGVRLVGPLLVVVGVVGGYFMIARLELPLGAVLIPIAVTLAGVAVTMRVTRGAGRVPKVPWAVITALGITYAGLVLWVLPALEQRKVVPDLAGFVMSHAAPTDRVASYQLNRWSSAFRFYVQRHTDVLDTPAQVRALLEAGEPFYCVMLEPAYQELVAQGLPLRALYVREGMWATSGRVLWRRKVPLARFVVVTTAS